MDPLIRIRKNFSDSPFSSDDLKGLGVTVGELNRLLNEESIYRISRGVYALAGLDLSNEELFRAATMRISGPSAVCLLSALEFYGITDHISKQVWLMAPEDKHTSHKDIRLLRSRNPKWKIGIETHDGYKITSLERTIVDALLLKRTMGLVGVESLKTALKQKKTTLHKINIIANQLGVEHRVRNYIEALA